MADYSIVPKEVPSNQRTMLIENVIPGDQIDFVEILGRPAARILVYAAADTDIVQYRLNNRKVLRGLLPGAPYGQSINADMVNPVYVRTDVVWSKTPVFTNEGAVFEIGTDIDVSSFELVSLTGLPSVTIVIR